LWLVLVVAPINTHLTTCLGQYIGALKPIILHEIITISAIKLLVGGGPYGGVEELRSSYGHLSLLSSCRTLTSGCVDPSALFLKGPIIDDFTKLVL
jgi:hypothetical protein